MIGACTPSHAMEIRYIVCLSIPFFVGSSACDHLLDYSQALLIRESLVLRASGLESGYST